MNKAQKSKTPIGIILLAIFLMWGLLNTYGTIFLPSESLDIGVLTHYNFLEVGYVLAAVILIFNLLSITAIFRRKKWGVKVLYTFFSLNIIFTLFNFILSIYNTEVMKAILLERGESVERIDIFLSPSLLIASPTIYIIFYALLALYVHKKRDFFSHG